MVGRFSALGWIGRIGVSATILCLVFSLVPLGHVAAVLSDVDGLWLTLALAVLLLEQVVVALRIKVLTDRNGMPLSARSILGINAIGAFYATFLPGEVASSAVRWYRMSKPTGQRAEAFAAIGFARLVDTVGLLALGSLFWLVDLPSGGGVIFILLLSGLVSLSLLLILSLHRPLHRGFLMLLRRLPACRPVTAVVTRVGKVMDAVGAYRTLPRLAVAALVIWTLARHLFGAVGMYLCTIAIGVSVDWVAVVWIKMMVSFVTMLPITVAGFGVREGALALLLAPHAVSGAEAVAIAFLLLLSRLLFAAIGGLLEGWDFFAGASPAKRERDGRDDHAPGRRPDLA